MKESFSIERLFVYENLERWRKSIRPELAGKNEHEADWILAAAVCDAQPGGDMIPTASERAAADVLRILCTMETAIANGEARKVFNGKPELVLLADSLQSAIAKLEHLTGNFALSASYPAADAHLLPADSTASGAKDATKAGTNRKTWDDARLRALWEESILPGVTQESLAKKHGVTRQRIGVLLQVAKGKFSKMKSTSPNTNPWGR